MDSLYATSMRNSEKQCKEEWGYQRFAFKRLFLTARGHCVSLIPTNIFTVTKILSYNGCCAMYSLQPSYRPVIEELENEEEDDSEEEETLENEEVSTETKSPSKEEKSSRILIEEIHSDDIVCDDTRLDVESTSAAGDVSRARHVWGPETQEAFAEEANATEGLTDVKESETIATGKEEIVAVETECEGSCGDGEGIKGDATSMEQNVKSVTSGTTECQSLDEDLESLD